MQDQMHGLVNTLESDVSALLKNDLLYLCFLTTEKTERYKLAQLALAQRGQEVGKDRATSWLAEEEIKLSRLLGVDKVEVE